MNGAPSDPVRNRRPIAARELRLSQQAASWLCRRGMSANAISVAGMIAGLLSGVALALTPVSGGLAPVLWFAAAALIQLRLVANMLDGMVAVASGTASRVGELYNEVPDRVSDTATLVGLGYAVGGEPTLGAIAAVAAIATAYIRVLGTAAGAPADFSGPMAKQQRMFVATLTSVICGGAALVDIPAAIAGYGVPTLALALIVVGGAATALRRLLRVARNLQERR